MKSLSRVRLFATPWTNVAHQAPPSMGFSRQEYWSGLSFPSPGDLPDPRIKPGSPALQADPLPSEAPGRSHVIPKAITSDRQVDQSPRRNYDYERIIRAMQGAMRQGIQVALEDRKGKEVDSPIEPLEGIQSCCYLDILISKVQDCKTVFF